MNKAERSLLRNFIVDVVILVNSTRVHAKLQDCDWGEKNAGLVDVFGKAASEQRTLRDSYIGNIWHFTEQLT
jgi:hypothetical protein